MRSAITITKLAAAAAAAASLGCGRGREQATAPEPPASSAEPPRPAPSAAAQPLPSAPAAEPAACADIKARFRKVFDGATGRCARDADCACYNPVAPGLSCGGVTDQATGARLAAIENEFHATRCRWPVNCAAHLCVPRCEAGRCR